MSAGININGFLNVFVNNQVSKLNKNTNKSSNSTVATNPGVADNIFAAASALVSDYKSNTNSKKSTTSSGKSMLQLANMSTEEFKNYASSNEAKSAFEAGKNDATGIKLPMIVRYKSEVFSTSGKSFMQVVAKIKAKFPRKSEEAIAAELMSKYATAEQINNVSQKYGTTQTTGNTISFSA